MYIGCPKVCLDYDHMSTGCAKILKMSSECPEVCLDYQISKGCLKIYLYYKYP